MSGSTDQPLSFVVQFKNEASSALSDLQAQIQHLSQNVGQLSQQHTTAVAGAIGLIGEQAVDSVVKFAEFEAMGVCLNATLQAMGQTARSASSTLGSGPGFISDADPNAFLPKMIALRPEPLPGGYLPERRRR